MKVLGRVRCVLGVVLLMLVATFLGVAPQAVAEEIPKLRIQASPARLDLEKMSPGKTYTETLKIQNTGSEDLKYELFVSPYSVNVEDDKYSPNYTNETNYNDIAEWITLSQDGGEIEPGEQDTITITVKVPQDVPAGGQYAAILARIANEAETTGNTISTLSQVSVVLYSSVDGKTREEGSVLENKVPSFMFAPPISVTSIVENTGNVHAEATYTLQVYPLFGGEEIYTNEENPERATIMPETRRLNTVTWDGAPQLGLFRIRQTVKFLDKESVTEKVLFICPIWFMMIILVLIFLVVFWIVTRARGRKED